MTPEREGRGPRMDQAGPVLRFEKGAKAEPAEPKARGRPAGAWKKASARMVAESAVQPEAAPVHEGAAPYVPDVPEASAVGKAPRPAGADTGPEAPPADGEPRQAEGGAAPDGGPAGLGQSVPKYRQHTPVRSPRPGDLVFFRYTYNAPDPDGVTHCGIYVGDGMMIHCGDPISYANLNSSYWQSHFYAYGRLP